MVVEAARFAADRHRHQRRKDAEATPNINHPLTVAAILCEVGIDDADVIVAALLHDTVEDTETTPAEIVTMFGKRVASMVAEVTDDKSLTKETRKQLQIAHAASKSEGARLIKLADKIANLRDLAEHPPQWNAERMRSYRQFAADVIAGARGVNATLDQVADRALGMRMDR